MNIEFDESVGEHAFECRDAYFKDAFDGDFAVRNPLNASLLNLSVAKRGRIPFILDHAIRIKMPMIKDKSVYHRRFL